MHCISKISSLEVAESVWKMDLNATLDDTDSKITTVSVVDLLYTLREKNHSFFI
jgi:hypothetical protein